MSLKGQRLRVLVNERLTAAAQEIFALFERTIAEYEEELCRSKEENKRKQQLLDSVLSPRVLLHRTVNEEGPVSVMVSGGCSVPIHLASDEDNPSTNEEESGSRPEQENPDCPRIKEEQNPCIKWEQDQEDFTFTSDLAHTEPEPEPEPDFHLDPDKYLQLNDEKLDWTQNWEPLKKEDGEDDSKEKDSEIHSQNSCSNPTESSENRRLSENRCLSENSAVLGRIMGRRPKHCSICGKIFSSKQDLERHMSVHTGEKPFSCSVCGKGFTRKGSLRSHAAVHTGEKPFRCSVCHKSFSQKGNLNAHVALHSGQKPFSCSQCHATFPLKSTLLRHMRSHTGVRPFKCPWCGRGFTRREHLKTHLRTHPAP